MTNRWPPEISFPFIASPLLFEVGIWVTSYNMWGDQTSSGNFLKKEEQAYDAERLYLLSLAKIGQIFACLVSSPDFSIYSKKATALFFIGSISIIYSNCFPKNDANKIPHNLFNLIASSFNIFAKVMNSLALGTAMHQFIHPNQKPSIFFYGAAALSLTFGISNLRNDYLYLSLIRDNKA